jgi:hypothetical protein
MPRHSALDGSESIHWPRWTSGIPGDERRFVGRPETGNRKSVQDAVLNSSQNQHDHLCSSTDNPGQVRYASPLKVGIALAAKELWNLDMGVLISN